MTEDTLSVVRILPNKYRVEAHDLSHGEAIEKLIELDKEHPHEDFAIVRSVPDNNP
jgi:tRNA(Ser,Leu) C12 N-acetylase TAN1